MYAYSVMVNVNFVLGNLIMNALPVNTEIIFMVLLADLLVLLRLSKMNKHLHAIIAKFLVVTVL